MHRNRTLKHLSLDYSGCDAKVGGDSHDYDFYEYALAPKASLLHVNVVIQAFTKMLHRNSVLEVLWMNHENAFSPTMLSEYFTELRLTFIDPVSYFIFPGHFLQAVTHVNQ